MHKYAIEQREEQDAWFDFCTYMKDCAQSMCGSSRKNDEAAAESGRPPGCRELIEFVSLLDAAASAVVGEVEEQAEAWWPPVRAELHHSSAMEPRLILDRSVRWD